MENNQVTIKVIKSAPYLVKGPVKLIHIDGTEEVKEELHLCCCGESKNKPFCDGSHVKAGFEK